jgi:hypothetical protein
VNLEENDQTNEESMTSSGEEVEKSEGSNEETAQGDEGALRRSTRPTRPPVRLRDYVSHKVMYPIQEFISYNMVSNQYKAYLTNINNQIEPTSFEEAHKDPIWCKAMEEELQALEKNCTWDIVVLPNHKKNL